ncbi:MAG: DUF1045 domain-containing protein, partial [Pseudomonadota bacterium]
WDSATGTSCTHPDSAGLDLSALTATPRPYGFHGTIKPPFHLADGETTDQLQRALAALCASSAPITLDGLRLARLGRFLALVPIRAHDGLANLAAKAVRDLDHFRAPLTDAERAKRRTANLSPAQEAHLQQWGYPYVLDQFRFHLTLSGKFDKTTLTLAEAALEPRLGALDLAPYQISGLTLMGQQENGRFYQIQRYALTG